MTGRKSKYRLGLNESQTALRDRLALVGDVFIAQMLRDLRGILALDEAWPNSDLHKSSSLPFFTVQGIADDTGLSADTVDKYVHAFIGLTQEDADYRTKRVTVDHKDAPLITLTGADDHTGVYVVQRGVPFREFLALHAGKFIDEGGNLISLPYGVIPHRLVSTRAMLFSILAPTMVKSSSKQGLKQARAELTEKYEMPRCTLEKIESPFREFKRRPDDAFTNDPVEDDEQLLLFAAHEPEPAPKVDWRAELGNQVAIAHEALEQARVIAANLAKVHDRINHLEESLWDIPKDVRDRILYEVYLAKMGPSIEPLR